jgi:hypothetical protein
VRGFCNAPLPYTSEQFLLQHMYRVRPDYCSLVIFAQIATFLDISLVLVGTPDNLALLYRAQLVAPALPSLRLLPSCLPLRT